MHQYHNLFVCNKQMGLIPLHFLTDVYFTNPAMIIADVIINIIVTMSLLDHIYSVGIFLLDQSIFIEVAVFIVFAFLKTLSLVQ